MSSEETGERTQPPTDRRRREARTRGEVARSSELVTALVLLGAIVGIRWLAPSLCTELAGFMKSTLSSAATTTMITEQKISAFLLSIGARMAIVVLPILLIIVAAAAVSNLVQTGFLWIPVTILPRLDRLNPVPRMNRWWATPSWFALAFAMLRLGILTYALVEFVRARLFSAGPLVEGSPAASFYLSARLMGELALELSAVMVALAIADYAFQFWWYERSLMMTIEEVRREQREEAGRPEIKQRQHELANASSNAIPRDLTGVRRV